MVYPEEPSIWAISPSHIPALYDDDGGDYGGKKSLSSSLRSSRKFP